MTQSHLDECARLGDAMVEPSLNRITVGGDAVRIPKRDMDVLLFLMKSEQKVITRDVIFDAVWGDVVVTDDALTLSISRLRKVLGDTPRNPRFIETIPKRGYRLMIAPELWQARTSSFFSRPSFWIVTLCVLLVLVTALFLLVRVEYQRVEDLHDLAPVSKSQG